MSTMNSNETVAMAEFAENIWNNYIKEKVEHGKRNYLSFYRATIVSKNADGTFTVERPYDNPVTVRASYGAEGLSANDQCLVIEFGKRNSGNALLVGTGSGLNLGLPTNEYISDAEIAELNALL